MRQTVHNFSQPFISNIGGYNSSHMLVKNPEQRYDQNSTASHQTDECSLLLNALSFRQSTVAYADRLILNTRGIQNPQNEMILNNSMNTSISGLLLQDSSKIDSNTLVYEKRDLVVNWIALIHTKYWFQQQTFHLAVSIIDRYLQQQPNPNTDFQLLAVTAFWVAAKIQQRKIKELKVWIKLGRGFQKDQIIQMQHHILQVLQYQVIISTSQIILWELIQNCTTLATKSIHLALYILELSMLDSSFRKYQSGIIALSSIYLCYKIHGIQQSDSNLDNLFLNHWDQIRKCSRKLCKTLQKSYEDAKSPIVRKYASRKFSQVSYTKFGKKSDSIMNYNSQSTINFH